jgi:peptidoglycan/LPS O-acetylase OafA/YrhL
MIPAKRNLGLDLIRFIAIYFVLIDHGGLNPFGKVLLGGLGVEIFFVLSGFLIGRIIIREFRNYQGVSTFRKFWVNRWFRTIPLYYLALGVQVISSGKLEVEYLYYLVFLQNNFYGITLFPVSWSLVIEEWFYLGLPFILLTIIYFFKSIRVQYLVYAVILLIIIKSLFIGFFNTPFAGVNGNILLRYDSMLIGVILALVFIDHSNIYQRLSHVRYFVFGVGATIILQFVVHSVVGLESFDDYAVFKVTYFLFQSILIAFTIPFFQTSRFINQRLTRIKGLAPFIVWTSILSYSFYLFHTNIIHFVQGFNLGSYTFLISLVVLYPMSFVIYHIYEKPLTNLRAKFN